MTFDLSSEIRNNIRWLIALSILIIVLGITVIVMSGIASVWFAGLPILLNSLRRSL